MTCAICKNRRRPAELCLREEKFYCDQHHSRWCRCREYVVVPFDTAQGRSALWRYSEELLEKWQSDGRERRLGAAIRDRLMRLWEEEDAGHRNT